MAIRLDDTDKKILALLQADATQSLDDIARKISSSKTPVWNRIKRMKEAQVIKQTTVLLDAEALGLEACFFVLIRTSEHDAAWQDAFLKALLERPEVQEAHLLNLARIVPDFEILGKAQELWETLFWPFAHPVIGNLKSKMAY